MALLGALCNLEGNLRNQLKNIVTKTVGKILARYNLCGWSSKLLLARKLVSPSLSHQTDRRRIPAVIMSTL